MTSVQAGEVEAVHALTTANVWKQQGVVVEGQTDILTMGLPYISPYNVNSILNPILVACLGPRLLLQPVPGPAAASARAASCIMTHPTPWEFNPVHHPSYIDFFEQVLSETTDPTEVADTLRGGLRHRPVVHPPLPDGPRLPRRPSLLHVVLVRPRPRAPRRASIIVGGDPKAVHRLGFRAGLDPGRRPRDGPGRGGPLPHPHPSARPAAS